MLLIWITCHLDELDLFLERDLSRSLLYRSDLRLESFDLSLDRYFFSNIYSLHFNTFLMRSAPPSSIMSWSRPRASFSISASPVAMVPLVWALSGKMSKFMTDIASLTTIIWLPTPYLFSVCPCSGTQSWFSSLRSPGQPVWMILFVLLHSLNSAVFVFVVEEGKWVVSMWGLLDDQTFNLSKLSTVFSEFLFQSDLAHLSLFQSLLCYPGSWWILCFWAPYHVIDSCCWVTSPSVRGYSICPT